MAPMASVWAAWDQDQDRLFRRRWPPPARLLAHPSHPMGRPEQRPAHMLLWRACSTLTHPPSCALAECLSCLPWPCKQRRVSTLL